MRRLIAPLKHGISATTHGPPASLEDVSVRRSLLLPAANAGLKDLPVPLKPTAAAINSTSFGADNQGMTHAAIDFGALLGHVTAGRASAPVHAGA